MKRFDNLFAEITSVESLFQSWNLFRLGKRHRFDVQQFERELEKNIFRLHRALICKRYKHSPYQSFFIQDPKVRHIRKACVIDRLVHQAVYSQLNRIFEPKLIHHLYSSRLGKGTHKGVFALKSAALKISKNNTRPCWALKCDVRKFYDSVDHEILFNLLKQSIKDQDALMLCREIIESFDIEGTPGKGLPIGNLTSQIFTNIYLNELDQFIKHTLRVKHYLRFADDFLLLSPNRKDLEETLPLLHSFLNEKLLLEIHPKKVSLRELHQGVDFLGYVTLPHHRVLRTTTKRRMIRKLSLRHKEYFDGKVTSESLNQSLQSYLGILTHADAFEFQEDIKNSFCWR